MKKDTRANASFEELQQEQSRHWKNVGQIRDARYQVVRSMLARGWRCPVCGSQNEDGCICKKCREARLIEVE